MDLVHFLSSLVESGSVVVTQDFQGEAGSDVEAVLQEIDRIHRLELPGNAPELIPAAALWGATLLHWSCQFLVCRDIDGGIIQRALNEPCPAPRSAATDYSVDLTFRFLPDLIGMTRHVASGDPLLQALLELATQWPLSSVGVPEVKKVDVSSFVGDPCLRQVYVDRILEKKDLTRIDTPEVIEAIRETLGGFPELSPAIAKQIEMPNALSNAA